jgi:aminopeptidase N
MTDQIAALSALVHVPGPERDAALAEFYEQWKQQPLVMLKWLDVQVRVLTPRCRTRHLLECQGSGTSTI